MTRGSVIEAGDELLFADEPSRPETGEPPRKEPWNVLVVDDEDDVHAVTKLVLERFEFKGRGIRLLHAFSAREARSLLQKTPDIALILLDVVMETDDAGLGLVEFVRGQLANRRTRIILRTGQPGQAPEQRVLHDYDINDYKSKTELTAARLYTCALTALRSYEDIVALENGRESLERILEAVSALLQTQSMELFASGVLSHLAALMGVGPVGMLCAYRGGPGATSKHDVIILASSGSLAFLNGKLFDNDVDPTITNPILTSLSSKRTVELPDTTAVYHEAPKGREIVVLMRAAAPLNESQKRLVSIYCEQLSAGLDNLHSVAALRDSHEQLMEAHLATVVTLASVAEMRSREAGEHVMRIAEMTAAMARFMRRNSEEAHLLDDGFMQSIGLASALHDIGKVTTPAPILSKAEALDEQEWAVMQTHALAGRSLLAAAHSVAPSSRYLELGMQIAGSHHEWFDGTGYPDGLSGTQIPLAARIVAVCEVFDALTHTRAYDEAWPIERAVAYIEERSGTQFDPEVVRAFLAVL